MILAIETSHTPGSVALAPESPDPAALLESTFPPGLVHGRELLPRIAELVERSGRERREIALVAVSAGPGSFTGIRIGVSAAKTLAWALDARLLAVSTLEAIAHNVSAEVVGADGEFAVVLDARRRACYGARFRRRGGLLERLSEDVCQAPEAFLATLAPDTPLVGEGIRLAAMAGSPHLPDELGLPRAAGILALARARRTAIETGDDAAPPEYHDPHGLAPSYLRACEAEERAGERAAGRSLSGGTKGNRNAPPTGVG